MNNKYIFPICWYNDGYTVKHNNITLWSEYPDNLYCVYYNCNSDKIQDKLSNCYIINYRCKCCCCNKNKYMDIVYHNTNIFIYHLVSVSYIQDKFLLQPIDISKDHNKSKIRIIKRTSLIYEELMSVTWRYERLYNWYLPYDYKIWI